MNRKLLRIYLNDHLAGAAGGLELADRALRANRGTEFTSFLERLRQDMESDKTALEELMSRLGIHVDPVKQAAAWLGEKAGRLKLNGSLTGYSPLSRMVELEALSAGVNAKLSLWQTLSQLDEDPVLAGFDHQRFIDRALAQVGELEQRRRAAARIAFTETA